MRWRACYYWSALPLSVEQNDETTSQDLPYRLLLADAQNVRSVWHHQANDQQLNPRRTAGLRAFSLTSHVTQRDAEIVAWTF
jgi:hypothetical protein